MNRTTTLIRTCIAATLSIALSAPAAVAGEELNGDPNPSATPAPGLSRTQPGASSDGPMTSPERYQSLSAALVGYYATQSQQSLDTYLGQNQPQLATLFSIEDPTGLPRLSADALPELDLQLQESGLAIDTSGYRDLRTAARAIDRSANSPDKHVIKFANNWTMRMTALRAPKLQAAGRLDTSIASDLPSSGLVFGMFVDKSLSALITDHPDVFAAVNASGLGSAKSRNAWKSSMAAAVKASRPDFDAMLPNSCVGSMLAVAASGSLDSSRSIGGRNCAGSCLTGGLYLHSQMMNMFTTTKTPASTNPADGYLSSSEWNNLQQWQRQGLTDQSPQLASQLATGGSAPTSVDCSTAKAATRASTQALLPGVFANLAPGRTLPGPFGNLQSR